MTPDRKRDAARKGPPFKPRLWRNPFGATWSNIENEEKRGKRWMETQKNPEKLQEHRIRVSSA